MADFRMPDINLVYLAGRLSRDPELRYLPSGMAFCKVGLAVSRKYKTKDGESREEVVFISATCWGKTAEFVGSSFHKGHPVLVQGRLHMEEWEDKTTGKKRTAISVMCDRFQCFEWHGNTRGKRPAETDTEHQNDSAPWEE